MASGSFAAALFDQFATGMKEDRKFGAESFELLFEQLDINVLDLETLLLAWKLNDASADFTCPCEFTRTQFVKKLCDMEVNNLEQLSTTLKNLKAALLDRRSVQTADEFESFYMFSFHCNCTAADPHMHERIGIGGLPIDDARALWSKLLQNQSEFLELWLNFLTASSTVCPTITSDIWFMVLKFCRAVCFNTNGINFESWQRDSFYPNLIDDFVKELHKSRQREILESSSENVEMGDLTNALTRELSTSETEALEVSSKDVAMGGMKNE